MHACKKAGGGAARRFISVLVAALLSVTMLPAAAFAAAEPFDPDNPATPVEVGTYAPGTYTVTANIFIPGDDNPLLSIQAYATNPNNPLGLNEDDDPAFTGSLPSTAMRNNAELVVGEDDSLTLTVPLRNPVFTIQQLEAGDGFEVVETTTREGSYFGKTSRIDSVTLKLHDSQKTSDGSDGYMFQNCIEYPTLIQTEWNVDLALTVDFSMVPYKDATLVLEPEVGEAFTYTGAEQTGVVLAENTHLVSGTLSATNAGDYSATVAPDEGFTWKDGTSDEKSYSWSIAKAPLTISYYKAVPNTVTTLPSADEVLSELVVSGFVNGDTPESLGDSYEAPVLEQWGVTSLDEETGVVDATYYDMDEAPTVKLDPGDLANLSIKTGTMENYEFAEVEPGDAVYTVAMTEAMEPTAVESLVYNGEEQVGIAFEGRPFDRTDKTITTYWGSIDPSENEGYTAVSAGAHTAVVHPNDGRVWADMTSDPKLVTYTIAKAPLSAAVVDESIALGDEPLLRVKASGFVNGEDESEAAGLVLPTAKVPENLEAGKSYDVVPSGGSADNYYFATYDAGTLTVLDEGVAPVPVAPQGLVYTGAEQVGVNESAAYDVTGVARATHAGEYEATVELKDGFAWGDASDDASKTVKWSIGKVQLTATCEAKPFAVGEPAPDFTPIVTGFVNGETPETAQDYTAPTLSLPEGYQQGVRYYADQNQSGKKLVATEGSALDYTFAYDYSGWTMEVPTMMALVPEAIDGLVYTGLPQVGVKTHPGSAIAAGSLMATNAGAYSVTAELSTSMYWGNADDLLSNKPQTVTWVIEKAPLIAKYPDQTISLGESPETTVEVTGFVNGETADTASGYIAPQVELPEALEAGKTYTVTPFGGYADNYEFEGGYESGTIRVLAENEVAVPVAVEGLEYTGSELIGVPEGEGYTLSGTWKATEPGTYTATAELEEGFVWADGTTDAKTFTWSIAGSSVGPSEPTVAWQGTATANLYLPGSENPVVSGLTAYMTNPANPVGEGGHSGIPNTPVENNATLVKYSDGRVVVTVDLPNPVFTMTAIGSASNADVLSQQTSGSRISQIEVELADASGTYTFSGSEVTITMLSKTFGAPLVLAVECEEAGIGGSTPTPVDPADALRDVIAEAKDVLASASVSADGSDVEGAWVTQEAHDALASAIVAAEGALESGNALQMATASSNLTGAIDAFKAAVEGDGYPGAGDAVGPTEPVDPSQVEDLIAALPAAEAVTSADKDSVYAARAAYQRLSDEEKAAFPVETLEKLEAAELALGEALVADMTDVAGHWSVSEGWLVEALGRGIVEGHRNPETGELTGLFEPDGSISRGQVATILYRLANPGATDTTVEEDYATSDGTFADVPEVAYYNAAIQWCAENGIVEGYRDPETGELTGLFGPDDPITREQLAKMVAETARAMGIDTAAGEGALSAFVDASGISPWAIGSVAWCAENGIMTGYGDTGVLNPNGGATRAEATKLIVGLMRIVEA